MDTSNNGQDAAIFKNIDNPVRAVSIRWYDAAQKTKSAEKGEIWCVRWAYIAMTLG